MTTFPSSSTPTRTGEVCSPPPDRRVMSTAWWLLATNARASSGPIRLPSPSSSGGHVRCSVRSRGGLRGFGRRWATPPQVMSHHPPVPTSIVHDHVPYAKVFTNHPAPAPSGSGGHPPTGPGTSGGGARCRPVGPAPRASDAPPAASPHDTEQHHPRCLVAAATGIAADLHQSGTTTSAFPDQPSLVLPSLWKGRRSHLAAG